MALSGQRATASLRGPIERVSAAEAVLRSIRHDIESGEYEIGAKLPSEADLASRYGVSRPVVREALHSCATLGMTETKTGRGTFVIATAANTGLQLGRYSARDLFEARPHIEVPAAALAAERRTEADLQVLREAHAAMSNLTADGDGRRAREWVALDAAFHTAIARASGNAIFESVIVEIRDAMAAQSEILTIAARRQEPSDAEHTRILRAIEDGDAEAARQAMSWHLRAVADAVETVVHGQSEVQ